MAILMSLQKKKKTLNSKC